MQKWGRTKAGKIRWYCRVCAKSSVQKRPDLEQRWLLLLFRNWVTGTDTLQRIASTRNHTRQALSKSFSSLWETIPVPTIPEDLGDTFLVADAIYLSGHNECVLIGRTGLNHVFWIFAR